MSLDTQLDKITPLQLLFGTAAAGVVGLALGLTVPHDITQIVGGGLVGGAIIAIPQIMLHVGFEDGMATARAILRPDLS